MTASLSLEYSCPAPIAVNLMQRFATIPALDELKGSIALNAQYNGSLKSFATQDTAADDTSDYKVTLSVIDASHKGLELENINGWVRIVPPGFFYVEDVSFLHKKEPVTLSGSIKGTRPARLDLSFTIADIEGRMQGDLNDGRLNASPLLLTTGGSRLETKGWLDFEGKQLDFAATGTLAADTLSELLQKRKIITDELAQRLNPMGTLKIASSVKGGFSPQSWNGELSLLSETLRINGYSLQDIDLRLNYNRNILAVSSLTAKSYDGTIDFAGSLDIARKQSLGSLALHNVDLALLQKDLPYKEKEIGGRLSLEAQFASNKIDSAKDWKGQGAAAITEGKIWGIQLFESLGEFLSLSDYTRIVFTKGWGRFSIKEASVYFDETTLASPQMNLKGHGRIGFDRSIDAMIFPTANPDMVSVSDDFRGILEGYIMGKVGPAFKINGTLDDPQFTTTFVSPLEPVTDILRGLLGAD